MNVEFISAALVESTKAPSFHILASIYRHRYTSHVPNMLQDIQTKNNISSDHFQAHKSNFPQSQTYNSEDMLLL